MGEGYHEKNSDFYSTFFILFVLGFVQVQADTVPISEYNPSSYSYGDVYKIDTRRKKQALYSVYLIFGDELSDVNLNLEYSGDAYIFYYFCKLLETVSSPSQSTIISFANQCKIRYVQHNYLVETSIYKFNAMAISKYYDYYDTSVLENEGVGDFYMDETAFDIDGEHIRFTILVSESILGTLLNSATVQNYSTLINSHEAMSLEDYNEQYSFHQIISTLFHGGITPFIITSLPWVLNETVHIYHEFYRSFTLDQTVYGYENGYEPISDEITYLGLIAYQTIHIIDNDKMASASNTSDDKVYMTREQHYFRYIYNQTYDTQTDAEAQGF